MNKINIATKLLGLLLFFPVFVSFEMKAEEVNPSDIQKVAINAFSLYSGISKSELIITQIIPVTKQDTAFFYIFNFDKGFIIVAADNVSVPIIGYGLENTIDMNDMPPAVSFLFDGYKEEIEVAKRMRPETSREILRLWEELLDDERGGASGESGQTGQTGVTLPNNKEEEGTPIYYKPGTWLMETKWGQSGGSASGSSISYNDSCPAINGTKTKVGCGGVALAQILNFYTCHITPKNYLKYLPQGFTDTIKINFSTVGYNWSKMSPENATKDNAKLLYHSAAAVKANFGTNNTSALLSNIENAFSYFDFTYPIRRYKSNYPIEANWINLLKSEIDKRRPIIYFGKNNVIGSSGHYWVVDGYSRDNNNNVSHFHCNWGWSGSGNGFWTLSSLTNINGSDYSYDNVALTVISALKGPIPYNDHTFPCGTIFAYSFRLYNCKVAQNVADAARLNMQCATEIFGTFEVPLGSVFEINIP